MENSPFYQLLNTKNDPSKELEALEILENHPELAKLHWQGNSENHQPFVLGSTALHYAANDGKLELMARLIACGADVNAAEAQWYATPLAWAANNAEIKAMRLLLVHGAHPRSLHALHAVAFGGASHGQNDPDAYVEAAQLLLDNGADIKDTREPQQRTPYQIAIECGNQRVAEFLKTKGARLK